MEMTSVANAEDFESYCAGLCRRLQLGSPVHLAAGPDRGKDVGTRVQLRGVSNKLFRIHVECKYYRSGASVGVTDVYPKHLWSIASGVDILVIITNARFTAGAYDWVEQTREQISQLIVLWDGEFLEWLESKSVGDDGQLDSEVIDRVHKNIADEWAEFGRHRANLTYDGFLHSAYRPMAAVAYPLFTDRKLELQRLGDFSAYRTASIAGPPGIGKTVLANELLNRAKAQGFAVLQHQLSYSSTNNFNNLVACVARLLHYERDSSNLLNYLATYGWQNSDLIISLAATELNNHRVFFLIEDVHGLSPGSQIADAINVFINSFSMARLLLTSRLDGLSPALSGRVDVQLSLNGFSRTDTQAYLIKSGVGAPEELSNRLFSDHFGWPLLLSMVASQKAASGDFVRQNHVRIGQFSDEENEIIDKLLAGISKPGCRLLACLSLLPVDLKRSELCVILELSSRQVHQAWVELNTHGLVAHIKSRRILGSVHSLIRERIVEVLADCQDLRIDIATYLAGFRDDALRLVGAASLFLEAEEFVNAAKIITSSGDVLIRHGLSCELADLVAAIPPHRIDEEHYLELAILKARLHEYLGQLEEGVVSLETAFHEYALNHAPRALVVTYRYQLARISYFLGRFTELEGLLARNIADLVDLDLLDPDCRRENLIKALTLQLLARHKYIQRDLEQAQSLYQRAHVIHKAIDDRIGLVKVRHRLAMIKALTGDLTTAKSEFAAICVESQRILDVKRHAYALHRLGELARIDGDPDLARELHRQSLELKEKAGHQRGIVFSNLELARIEITATNAEAALNHLDIAIRFATDIGLPKELGMAYFLRGVLHDRCGEEDEAKNWMEKACREFESIGLENRADLIRNRRFEELIRLD